MPKLRDYFEQDMGTFMNQDEFATIHNINGTDMAIVLDSDLLEERKQKLGEGIYSGEILFHVAKQDYGDPPALGQHVTFDARKGYRVSDFQENEGIYTITLEVVRS